MPDCCAVPVAHVAVPLALQVITVGGAMTLLHCPGMCGPIIGGLRFGFEKAGPPSPGRAALGVLGYQAGRAVVYAGFGAAVGAAGMGFRTGLQTWAPLVTLAMGLGLILWAVRDLLPRRRAIATTAPATPGRIARTAGAVSAALARRPLVRALALGAVLAFMPCGVLFWVLSLAAASGDPLQGAGLTALLVAITLPVLLLAALVPAGIGRLRRFAAPWIGRAAFAFSGAWLLLISLAGLGAIPHAQIPLGELRVMLW